MKITLDYHYNKCTKICNTKIISSNLKIGKSLEKIIKNSFIQMTKQ